jgi:hypothetical protein
VLTLKERVNLFEEDSRVLERISAQYAEGSNEYRSLKHAAIALWYAMAENFEGFKKYVEKCQGELGPEQRTRLEEMGIDPDFDPDPGESDSD